MHVARAKEPGAGEHASRDDGQVVGDHHLLEEAPHGEMKTRGDVAPAHVPRLLHLRQQRPRGHDRTRHHVREERHEEGEVDRVLGGLHLAPIDVDDVADALEGVEGDPDGQDHVEVKAQGVEARGLEQGIERAHEEVAVLEVAEEEQVDEDAQGHPTLGLRGPAHAGDRRPQEPVGGAGQEEESQEPPVPAGVEEIARGQEEEVLAAPREERVHAQHEREKQPELKGVEEHAGSSKERLGEGV